MELTREQKIRDLNDFCLLHCNECNNCVLNDGNCRYQVFRDYTDSKVNECWDTVFGIEDDDPVNHPSHYTKGGVECIDAIKASLSHEAFLGFLKGNVMKYVFRYESKQNPEEDLNKALWYLNRLIEEL